MTGPSATGGGDWVRRVVSLGGVVLLAFLVAHAGLGRIVSLLLLLGPNLLIVVALFTCHESVRALAINRCLPPDRRLQFRQLLRIRFLGEVAGALTRTGPFAAEPARAWMLGGQAAGGAHGYAAAAAELMANSGTSALVTVAATAAALETTGLKGQVSALAQTLLWISVGYVALLGVVVASRAYALGAVLRLVAALPVIGRRLKTDPARVREIEGAVMDAFVRRPVALAQVLCLETLAQSILVFEVYWTVRSMGVAISARSALLIEVLTKAANVIQFVGVTEAGYAVVFAWLGLTAAAGLTLSLVKTVRSLTGSALGLGLLVPESRRA